jgi:hypothetical protein
MPWESLGEVETGTLDRDDSWEEFCEQTAIRYLKLVCGEPPPGSQLGMMSNDHDLGTYTTVGVYWDYSHPTEYISACEISLNVFNDSVDWCALRAQLEKEVFKDGDFEDTT